MKRNLLFCVVLLLISLTMGSCAHTQPGGEDSSSKLLSGDSVVPTESTSNVLHSSADESEEVSPSSLRTMTPSKHTVDREDGYYTYDLDGRWSGFSLRDDRCPSDIPSESHLSEEELHRRAEAYLSDKVPLDLYQFLNAKDTPYNDSIVFIYTREVKGYPSFDEVSATIAYDGTIVDFYAPRVGIFDSIDEASIPEIDEAKLQERLTALMKEQFGDVTYTEYPQKRILSIMEDGTFAMYMVALPDGMDEIYTWSFHVPIA